MKIFLTLILLLYPLFAEIHLYLHTPSKLPSKQLNTSFGHELLNLINKAQDSIYFAIYGLRGQDDILNPNYAIESYNIIKFYRVKGSGLYF
jgi:hypothetical protein